MTFLNSAGLWILLGVPLLIIIFIIRSRHRQKQVSSTFIWQLSERLKKKRFHFSALSRIFLLLTEILAVVLMALFVARPVIDHRDSVDYILVFDSSSSMEVKTEEGRTLFERAKVEAENYLEKLKDGHRVSVIAAGDKAVCPLRYCTDENRLQLTLEAIRCDEGSCDLEAAFAMVNEISVNTLHPQVVLFTDKEVSSELPEYISVVDLSKDQKLPNLSVIGVMSERIGKNILFKADVHARDFEGKATVALKIDGKIADAVIAELRDGETSTVEFTVPYTDYETAEVYPVTPDNYDKDDSYVLCKKYLRSRTIQLVSDAPYYLNAILKLFEGCKIDLLDSTAEPATEGYDIYIYDGVEPRALPHDGSIILFNAPCAFLGVQMDETRSVEAVIERSSEADIRLVPDWNKSETLVGSYKVLSCGSLYTTLLTCADEQVCATRVLPNGLTVTVFSFDLHDTNLPMQEKFVRLISDLLEFSAPSLIKTGHAQIGSTLELRAEYDASLELLSPSGETRMLSLDGGKAEYTPTALGVYRLREIFEDQSDLSVSFFVHVPAEECVKGEITQLTEIEKAANEKEAKEATLEIALPIAVAMFILLLCAWGVYLYEQY